MAANLGRFTYRVHIAHSDRIVLNICNCNNSYNNIFFSSIGNKKNKKYNKRRKTHII